MSSSFWTAQPGATQGRIQPTGADPAAGDWLFCLGSDTEGATALLAVNDYAEISQTGDTTVSGSNVVRFSATIRPPSSTPAGCYWWFSFRLDDVEIKGQRIDPGRTRARVDMAANVAGITADQKVAFRLTLMGAGGPYAVELPGVYIDAVVLDTVADTAPFLFNRDPEPNETSIPTNQTIAVDIGTTKAASTIDLSSVEITVDGVLAFDGGAFQSGFTGPESAYSNPQTNVLRVLIDSNDPLADTLETGLVVSAALTGDATNAIDERYWFRTADLENPTITEAVASGLDELRVTFSEAMLATSATGDGDALNPSSWALALVTGDDQTRLPAVEASVESVAALADDQFVLTTDIELTPGATYDVTTTARDAAGNPILVADGTARLVGFQPDVPPERNFVLLDMLPRDTVAKDTSGDLANFIGVWQEIAELLLYEIDGIAEELDPDTASESMVDAMLADLGNPFDFELSLADKRRLISVLVPLYRQKGTNQGIINAIRFFLGIDVTITEMGAAGGYLGLDTLGGTLILGTGSLALKLTFIVVVPIELTATQEARMRSLIEYMMRGECHYQISQPSAPVTIDHWAIGASRIGTQSILH